jgi:hypothetical protein
MLYQLEGGMLRVFFLKEEKIWSHIDWPITNCSVELGTLPPPPPLHVHAWALPKSESIGHSFTVYAHGSWTLAKAYGIKLRCYWEHLGEFLSNPLGTWWEHIGNRKKKEEKNPSPPPPTPKVKNNPLNACWAFSLVAWNLYFQLKPTYVRRAMDEFHFAMVKSQFLCWYNLALNTRTCKASLWFFTSLFHIHLGLCKIFAESL